MLVEAIEMTLENPFTHWGRSSAWFPIFSSSHSSAAGFIVTIATREGKTIRSGTNSSIGWDIRRRTGATFRLDESVTAQGESSHEALPSFLVGIWKGSCLWRLGKATCVGHTSSPSMSSNWYFFRLTLILLFFQER